MENILVSILVATYNQKNVILDTIESIINQTYKNIEIIISDDGSTDGTREILKDIASKDTRIILHLQEKNLGITSNYNFLVKSAKGYFISLFSGDDVMYPSKIEKQVSLMLLKKNASFCHHSVVNIDYATSKIQNIVKHKYHKNITTINDVLRNFGIPGSMSILYRKEVLSDPVFDPDIKTASDWLQIIDLCAAGEGYYIDEVLCQYRKDKNYNGKDPSKYETDFLLTIEKTRQKYGLNDTVIQKSCNYALARYSLGAAYRYVILNENIKARLLLVNVLNIPNFFIQGIIILLFTYVKLPKIIIINLKKLYKK